MELKIMMELGLECKITERKGEMMKVAEIARKFRPVIQRHARKKR